MDIKRTIILLAIVVLFFSCGKSYVLEDDPIKEPVKKTVKKDDLKHQKISETPLAKDFTIKKGFREEGTASWYGPNFHGKWTASGKKYNMNKLSCAHKFLPMGTKVKITNIDNDRSIIVEVEDRGPYVYGRIVDLSKKAAKKLDVISKGLAHVKLKVIALPEKIPPYFVIQMGAFSDLQRAIKLQKKLVKGHFPAFIRNIKDVYKLYIGPYPSSNRCEKFQEKLIDQGFEKGFVRKLNI